MPATWSEKPKPLLVVDDDPVTRRVMRAVLENGGFEIVEAGGGEQALEQFSTHDPELVLLDLTMPGMDGFTVCATLRRQFRALNVPIVIITGLDDVTSINRAFEIGATDFITKPITPALLLPRVRYLLRASRAMNEVQKNEERLRQVLQNMPVMLGALDENGNHIVWNRECEEVTGYRASEIIGNRNAWELLYPEADYREQLLKRLSAEKQVSRNNEWVMTAKSGEKKTVAWSNISPAFPIPGWSTWAVGVDITERKQAEKALAVNEGNYRKLSQEFSTLLDGIPDTLSLVSPTGRVIWSNKATAEVLGLPPGLAFGKFCHEYWQQTSAPCPGCPVHKSLKSGQTEEGIDHTPDGKIWGIKAFPLKDQEGTITGVIRLASNITEKIRIKENAARSSHLAALGELAAGVAHEINNPNGLILLNAPILQEVFAASLSWMEEHLQDSEDFRLGRMPFSRLKKEIPRMLDQVLDGARRIGRIVDDLKNFARQGDEADMETFSPNQAVETALRLTSNFTKKTTNRLAVEYGEHLPSLKGNIQRIEQVLVNLIMNACQALTDRDQGVHISTRYDQAGGRCIIEVRDNGSGIAPENLSHLTDPFFTTKRETGGTGLGLSVSARIVKEHGGQLDFSSVQGKGTTVTLALPALLEA